MNDQDAHKEIQNLREIVSALLGVVTVMAEDMPQDSAARAIGMLYRPARAGLDIGPLSAALRKPRQS